MWQVAAIYRQELFATIGYFDDDYFAYLEDVDFGLRAQSAGFKCYYVPTAIVYHLGCGTTGSGYSPLVVRLSSQNNLNTIVKNILATADQILARNSLLAILLSCRCHRARCANYSLDPRVFWCFETSA